MGEVLTVSGSNFLPDTKITWNGTMQPTQYTSAATLQLTMSKSSFSGAATVQIGVINSSTDGGQSSNTVPFTISNSPNPNPVPALTSINPASEVTRASTTTITLTGSNFIPNSEVDWNGMPLSSIYQSATTLTAFIPATDLQTAGTALVTVKNPAPDGGTSSAVNFTVAAGQAVVNIIANDLAWDPVNQVIYLSIASSAGSNSNTIQVLNPVTGVLRQSVLVASEPDLLSVSANSKYLYASANSVYLYANMGGSNSVQRFVLPGLTPDISTSLGTDPYGFPFIAMDLQASPASDGTVAVVRATTRAIPKEEGGVLIYDNGVARPDVLCGFREPTCPPDGAIYDSIQWNPSATEMYALDNEDDHPWFYSIPVTSAGFGTVTSYGNPWAKFLDDTIHYDAPTQLIYGDDGEVINPATGSGSGDFATSGLGVPDGKLGVMFVLSSSWQGTQWTLSWYDINNFTLIGSMTINNVVGTPTHLIRWGSNGLAFTTQYWLPNGAGYTKAGSVYLVTGSF